MSKRMKMLFTVSVVVNVLLIGLIGGHVVRGYKALPWNDKAFSDPARAAMKATFKEIAPLKQRVWAKKSALQEVLAADDFDAAAFDGLAAEIASLKGDFEGRKLAAMKEVVLSLSDEERKALAAHMAERLERRQGRWMAREKRMKGRSE